jgi:hypothetical protein
MFFQIIQKVLSDVSYVRQLTGAIKETVVGSYVESLEYSHGEYSWIFCKSDNN